MATPTPTARTGLWLLTALLLLAAPAALIALVLSGGEHRDRPPGVDSARTAVGMEHVHGLGVDPGDGRLYAATHVGVFVVDDDGTAQRVGSRQDTMGFTIVGPSAFLASGHPDPAEDDEPLMGLIGSTDAGRSWQPLSLRGEADFHALRYAHDTVYGYDATSGTFMTSDDRSTWQRLSRLSLRDFAVSPARPDAIMETTEQGPVRSADGGRTWQRLPGAPALVVLAWPAEEVLYGVDVDGAVHASADGGSTWATRGSAGGPPEAVTVHPDRTQTVYAALRGGRVVVSEDGGRTFVERYVPS